ncbi:KIR-like protein [Plasmodium coatneyi]|uniref:KIR-like protein n=1 Tax=Plasmodium coatneyi TaxID=208452 RepID=A0A1B1E6K5_9APIC|nr:KIR-like protein [Plasmodium coatneyi]ANQ10628.1 KIR-like protein [Plasmodium coatneyi]
MATENCWWDGSSKSRYKELQEAAEDNNTCNRCKVTRKSVLQAAVEDHKGVENAVEKMINAWCYVNTREQDKSMYCDLFYYWLGEILFGALGKSASVPEVMSVIYTKLQIWLPIDSCTRTCPQVTKDEFDKLKKLHDYNQDYRNLDTRIGTASGTCLGEYEKYIRDTDEIYGRVSNDCIGSTDMERNLCTEWGRTTLRTQYEAMQNGGNSLSKLKAEIQQRKNTIGVAASAKFPLTLPQVQTIHGKPAESTEGNEYIIQKYYYRRKGRNVNHMSKKEEARPTGEKGSAPERGEPGPGGVAGELGALGHETTAEGGLKGPKVKGDVDVSLPKVDIDVPGPEVSAEASTLVKQNPDSRAEAEQLWGGVTIPTVPIVSATLPTIAGIGAAALFLYKYTSIFFPKNNSTRRRKRFVRQDLNALMDYSTEYSTLDSTLYSRSGPTLYSRSGPTLYSRLSSRVGSTLGSTLSSTLDSTLSSTLDSTLSSTLGSTAGSSFDSAYDSTNDSTYSSTNDSTNNSTYSSTNDSTNNSTYSSTNDSTYNSSEYSTSESGTVDSVSYTTHSSRRRTNNNRRRRNTPNRRKNIGYHSM